MKTPTRTGLMAAAANLDVELAMFPPGIRIVASADDFFPLEYLTIEKKLNAIAGFCRAIRSIPANWVCDG